MTIKELNKLIKEELDAFMQEDEMDDSIDAGDDIEVTTDEPDEDLVGRLRGSGLLLGPLLVRRGTARLTTPGGDFPARRTTIGTATSIFFRA